MNPRLGRVLRALRVRREWRQEDVARRAGVSRATVSLAERGEIDGMTLGMLVRMAATLEIRLDVVPRWRGGDLDRLLDAKHAGLAERVAAYLAAFPEWVLAPEVSFAIYAERGRIDILAWHAPSRSLLVIEVKTELADLQATLETLDVKQRLAVQVAARRDWHATTVSVWLVVSGSRTNRRRVAAHGTLLRSAFPDGRQRLRDWLRAPAGTVAALTFWPTATTSSASQGIAPIHRVRRRSGAPSERAPGSSRLPTPPGDRD